MAIEIILRATVIEIVTKQWRTLSAKRVWTHVMAHQSHIMKQPNKPNKSSWWWLRRNWIYNNKIAPVKWISNSPTTRCRHIAAHTQFLPRLSTGRTTIALLRLQYFWKKKTFSPSSSTAESDAAWKTAMTTNLMHSNKLRAVAMWQRNRSRASKR